MTLPAVICVLAVAVGLCCHACDQLKAGLPWQRAFNCGVVLWWAAIILATGWWSLAIWIVGTVVLIYLSLKVVGK